MAHVMKRLGAMLLGVAVAFPVFFGASYAFDQAISGDPAYRAGTDLWARKSGTTNTKQDITSTGNALDVNIASGSTTPPTGASATQVQGTAASDAPVVGNPVQNGGRASNATPSAVSLAGDAVAQWLSLSGATVVAGSDGSNTRTLLTSSTGALATSDNKTPVDNFANNSAQMFVSGGTSATYAPLQVFPSFYDGSTWDLFRGNSAGGLFVQGPAAAAATAAGNPLLGGGVYTTNANQPAITTGQIGNLQTDPAGNLRTAPQRPTATDILVGYATVTATTGTTTLITVSAGRTWVGQLCASVDGNKAAAATGNGLVNATFLTTGTNVVPAAGTYFGVSTSIGANAATGTVGTQGSNANCTDFTTVAPAGNTTTINYATTCTNTTACAVHVSAIGVMQ